MNNVDILHSLREVMLLCYASLKNIIVWAVQQQQSSGTIFCKKWTFISFYLTILRWKFWTLNSKQSLSAPKWSKMIILINQKLIKLSLC